MKLSVTIGVLVSCLFFMASAFVEEGTGLLPVNQKQDTPAPLSAPKHSSTAKSRAVLYTFKLLLLAVGLVTAVGLVYAYGEKVANFASSFMGAEAQSLYIPTSEPARTLEPEMGGRAFDTISNNGFSNF